MDIVVNIVASGSQEDVIKALQHTISCIEIADDSLSTKGETITQKGLICTAYKVIG